MTGGVANNTGMTAALRRRLKTDLNIPNEPHLVGAFGAALIARDSWTYFNR